MEEAREISRDMRLTGKSRFANAEEMFSALEKTSVD